jgi:hypothetical protein
MATFVLVFAAKERGKIQRSRLRVFKSAWRNLNGVFLSPQTEEYSQTFQWYREIKR